MSNPPAPKPKLQPVDWAVLIGGPLIFLLIAYFGITALLGPPPRPNPITAIRDQKVTVGQPWSEARERLGPPTSRVDYPDGSFLLRFTRTDWSGVTKERDATLMQDDGIHPTAEAQSMILDNVWPTLKTLLPDAGNAVAHQ